MFAAVSADHDDDDGGVVGGLTVGAGDRGGVGVALPFGSRDCGRDASQSTPHSLHHPRRLPLPGLVTLVVCTLAGGAGTPSDSDNIVSVSGLEASHLLSESCCPSLKHRVMPEGSESQKKRE